MKKILRLENLECAHCATLMESGIRNINGVTDASINFMTQKLIIEADEPRIDAIIMTAKKICKNIEPDCIILT